MRIPIEMQKKILTALERGEHVARRFEVSDRGLHKLTPADDAALLEMIETDPGVTLNTICAQLSVKVAESTPQAASNTTPSAVVIGTIRHNPAR